MKTYEVPWSNHVTTYSQILSPLDILNQVNSNIQFVLLLLV